MVRLAHALKLQVVAEGVETETQVQRLRELGCDQLQGFLFAKPMPELALLAWIKQGPVLLARDLPFDGAAIESTHGQLPFPTMAT